MAPFPVDPSGEMASPHFSPGGVMMAQEFFPQCVLASEERSGFYGRASMCALRGKGQARARPAPSVLACPHKKSNKVLKINAFHTASSDPVRNAGWTVPGFVRAGRPRSREAFIP